MSPVARDPRDEPVEKKCTQCDEPIAVGDTYYRLMVALHKNTSRWWVSKKRVNDMTICADCYQAVKQALIGRARVVAHGRELGDFMARERGL